MAKSITGLIKANSERTSLEAREFGRKGGLASAESRRHKKMLRDVFNELLPMEVPEGEIRNALSNAGLEPTHETAMALAVLLKAENGDVDAARFIRDTRGEKPSETLSLAHYLAYGQIPDEYGLRMLSNEELIALAESNET